MWLGGTLKAQTSLAGPTHFRKWVGLARLSSNLPEVQDCLRNSSLSASTQPNTCCFTAFVLASAIVDLT